LAAVDVGDDIGERAGTRFKLRLSTGGVAKGAR
jgi:hypothetical protein